MLYYCFMDFKQPFDIIPRCELWKRMIETGMPLECKTIIAFLYEQVKCQLKMESKCELVLSHLMHEMK